MTQRAPGLERLSSINVDGSRQHPQPADVKGRFVRARTLVYALLIVIYVALPFVKIGGYPAMQLDVAARRFYLFGSVFNAQDFWRVALLVVIGCVGLLFLTAWIGRVWCGWACPQTVFLEGVYRRLERWIDGPRQKRIRLMYGPWTIEKVIRRVVKHAAFLAVSMALAHVAMAFFVTPLGVLEMIRSGPGAHWTAFLWVTIIALALYFNFAWFREQLCIVVCPYGRLQSVLLDRDSLIIGYDVNRGEPRGKIRRRSRQRPSGRPPIPSGSSSSPSKTTSAPSPTPTNISTPPAPTTGSVSLPVVEKVAAKAATPQPTLRSSGAPSTPSTPQTPSTPSTPSTALTPSTSSTPSTSLTPPTPSTPSTALTPSTSSSPTSSIAPTSSTQSSIAALVAAASSAPVEAKGAMETIGKPPPGVDATCGDSPVGNLAAMSENPPLGDCIDCNRCVVVCPTGIDIRNGTQMECIACAQCIDACDEVMTKVGRPTGLIRYDSQNGLEGQAKRTFRPRLAVYGAMLVVASVVFLMATATRQPFEANPLRVRGAPYIIENGSIRNQFELHLVNKNPEASELSVKVTSPVQMDVTLPHSSVTLDPLDHFRLPVFVRVAREDWSGPFEIVFHVSDSASGSMRDVKARFLGPAGPLAALPGGGRADSSVASAQ